MKRRQLLAAAAILPFSKLVTASDFAEFMNFQEIGAQSLENEFETYQAAYLKEFSAYKKSIAKEWDEARVSSPSNWVSYADKNKARTTLDYRNNTIEIAIRSDNNPSPEKINNLVAKAIAESASQAIKNDPVLHKLKTQAETNSAISMSGIKLSKEATAELVDQATVINDQDSKGEYIKVTVKLPEKAKTERVRQFLPAVRKYSQEFKVGLPLVLAVIHTESAFNPLAQSHVPAFGLMQIVPSSAGKDVQRLIYQRDSAPTSSMLFNPDTNIQHGCAYLHILNYRYLKAIKNKAAREHCCIAAYNTGAGNVAKAFTGKTNVRSAAKIINQMTPEAVYQHLCKNLTHKEARDYVYKVNQYKSVYSA